VSDGGKENFLCGKMRGYFTFHVLIIMKTVVGSSDLQKMHKVKGVTIILSMLDGNM
jgi:hypothetical protein